MHFEWDENKNQANIKKHKIDFNAAATVFLDENLVEVFDDRHSADEERYVVIGKMYNTTIVLYVSYTERGEVIRIISARKATKTEKEGYYNGYYEICT